MTLHVYLTDEVKEDSRFKSKPYKDGSGDKMSIDGEAIYADGGLHLQLGDVDIVPPAALPYVSRVSIIAHLVAQRSRRELGIYKHNTAKAEIELQHPGTKDETYLILINSDKLVDGLDLLRLFKTGMIRPTESFEGEQKGLSRVELEQKVEELTQQLELLQNKSTAA